MHTVRNKGSSSTYVNKGIAKIVLNELCRRSAGLKVCHFNAQSLFPKIDEFKDVFSSNSVDVVCISETWLQPHVTDQLISLSNFKIYRNDRNSRGGGVAIYINKSLKSRKIASSSACDTTEYIFIEILNGIDKCLLGCVYKPPDVTSLDDTAFENFVASNAANYNHIIIAGDFNFNLLQSNKPVNEFKDFLSLYSLSSVNSSYPTHFTATSATLLDLFLVSNVLSVLKYDQITFSGFSNHDLIFMCYDWHPKNISAETFSFPDLNSVDMRAVFRDADSFNWRTFYTLTCVDEQLDFLNNFIVDLYVKHVPFKTRKNICKDCPWFTSRIRKLITDRDMAYKRWKRYRLLDSWLLYKKLRNCVNYEIRKSKSRFFKTKLDTRLPMKKLWSNLKQIGVGRAVAEISDVDCNALNQHFSTTSYSHSNHDIQNAIFYNTGTCPIANNSGFTLCQDFSFRSVSELDVFNAISAIKSNASGLDGLNTRFIKMIAPKIVVSLAKIFNNIIMRSTFPIIWKVAKVIPVPKKVCPGPYDYRPIAILPFLSKVFEKLLSQQITEFLECHKLLANLQSGFRKFRSCTSALLKVSDDIRQEIDSNRHTILVLLDFSKAFDSVDHTLLLRKLEIYFNFSTSAIALIKSYLFNRRQLVSCNGKSSSLLPNTTGVPQGSILGPLLFSMFINDLPLVLKHCSYHLYADDLQIYASNVKDSLNLTVQQINNDLESIRQWSCANRLLLNAKKSLSIVFSRKDPDLDLDCIYLNGSVLPYNNTVRNLGVIFDKKLSWKFHVDNVVSKVYGALRKLSLSAHYTPLKTRLMLVKSLIMPVCLYGCEIYSGVDALSFRKLEVAFNCCIRYVFNMKRFDHISEFKNSILGCSLKSYLDYRSLIFLHNIICSKKPEYLYEKINFCRSKRTHSLIPTRATCYLSTRQFFVSTVSKWNELPLSVRRQSDSKGFRKVLFRYFVDSNNTS